MNHSHTDASSDKSTAATTMQAVVLEQEGPPEVLSVAQVAAPTPAPGEALVRVKFAALNHLDVWIRKGMPSVPKPRIMGADACGVVEAVADAADEQWVGQRVVLDPSVTCGTCRYCAAGDTALCQRFQVLGEHTAGTHAQYICVPVANLHQAPAHLDDAAAAALPLTFATAWRMIRSRARVEPGERMLVWGASAGVGAAAVQLAAAMGIETIGTSRSADKLAAIRELGADHTIDTSSEDVVERVRAITGGDGVDVVFDHLGDVAWKPSLSALAKGGRYVTCGATTGATPPALITRIFWKQLSILGSTMASKRDFANMVRFVELHRITPRVDRIYPLDAIATAHAALEGSEHVGKIVLELP